MADARCAVASNMFRADNIHLSLRLQDTDGPFKHDPAVTVYHPTTPGAHAFANVGFLGFIGTFSGQSETQLAVSEIGVSFPDKEHFGTETFEGVPFVYLLRDVLEFDTTVFDSVSRMENANRTCDLILGVGDGKEETFRGFAYSASELFVYNGAGRGQCASCCVVSPLSTATAANLLHCTHLRRHQSAAVERHCRHVAPAL